GEVAALLLAPRRAGGGDGRQGQTARAGGPALFARRAGRLRRFALKYRRNGTRLDVRDPPVTFARTKYTRASPVFPWWVPSLEVSCIDVSRSSQPCSPALSPAWRRCRSS